MSNRRLIDELVRMGMIESIVIKMTGYCYKFFIYDRVPNVLAFVIVR